MNISPINILISAFKNIMEQIIIKKTKKEYNGAHSCIHLHTKVNLIHQVVIYEVSYPPGFVTPKSINQYLPYLCECFAGQHKAAENGRPPRG